MATNPMQKKARNSFIAGMLLAFLLVAIIAVIGVVIYINEQNKEEEDPLVNVIVLGEDVSSGQIITEEMLLLNSVPTSTVPSNATSDFADITNYSLQDKSGNTVSTKYNDDNEPELYIEIEEEEYKLEQEDATENYYIMKDNKKEYIELNSVPLVAKIDMNANTVITSDLLNKSDNPIQDDTRTEEYNMLSLPMDIVTGDYVDVRLMLPTGQNYIVLAKEEVEIPVIDGMDSADTVKFNLTEDEILHMSCAIVEAYRIDGAKLYLAKYTEPGMQEAAIETYPVNAEVAKLIQNDPNILQTAREEIENRYNITGATTLRNDDINAQIVNAGEAGVEKVKTEMNNSITRAEENRREYLESISE